MRSNSVKKIYVGDKLMADKTSILKVRFDLSHIEQHRYEQICFTLGRGETESDEHLIMRMLAYAMMPEQRLSFGSGVNGTSIGIGASPDVMVKDYDDHYIYWVDVGFPSVERIKRASNQSDHVIVVSVNQSEWLNENQSQLLGLSNVKLILLEQQWLTEMSSQLCRSINWSLVIDDAKIGISTGQVYCESTISRLDQPVAYKMAS